jgi:hypothetical protein
MTVRRGALSLAALFLCASASACTANTYRYVDHAVGKTDMYFKVPASWHVLSQADFIEENNPGLSRSQISQFEQGSWIEAYDASPHPSVKDLLNFGATDPFVIAIEHSLSPQQQDSYSISSLRTEILPSDPLSGQTGAGGPQYVDPTYSVLTEPGGFVGGQLKVDLVGQNGTYYTYEQKGLINRTTSQVFVIAAGCQAACFGRNQSAISAVLSSWNVRKEN